MMGVFRFFLARMPTPVGNRIADLFGEVVYRFARRSRRAALSNMRHVMGNVPRKRLRRAARGVLRNVMRNYYDLCRAPDMSDGDLDRAVDFDTVGWEAVEKAHQEGRGVLLVTGHFGAFDVITQVISRRGIPVTFLVTQVKPAWLSDFITDLRGDRGLNLITVDEEEGGGVNLTALKSSIGLLRRGEVLGVVADRNTEQRGVTIRFFGHPTVVAPGVAKIALRTKALIVPGFCHRLPKGRYDVVFGPPIEPVGSAQNDEDVRSLLQQIFTRFEYHVKRNPEQWVLLQPVWPKHVKSKE